MDIEISSTGRKIPSLKSSLPLTLDESFKDLAKIYANRNDERSSWPLAGAIRELLKAVEIANKQLGENTVVLLARNALESAITDATKWKKIGIVGPPETDGIVVWIGNKELVFHYVYNVIDDWFSICITNHNKRENKLKYMCGFENQGMPEKLAAIFIKLARDEPLLPQRPPFAWLRDLWKHKNTPSARVHPS